ncbi:SMI1/KNR4 family protein [Streptomyces sp. 11x1]|uniref:SMI1/KNR4 family protein n=1 Tax=Streptomyces sp. 11x1 TaxID=3038642 RepID=UPI002930D21B|nr:SMI1/KNR4 family protein [Streptomyces sp. 11x1]WNZ12105.1 SMI1/KNR4 family protein [Streptomyces sp. 11x1]
MELSRFREFLGQPQVNGDISRDWRALEAGLAEQLPQDYKEFVTAYGPGCINDQLYLFHPRAAGGEEGLRLESLWEQASQAFGDLSSSYPELYPFAIYPARGGCLPVCRSISGNHVFIQPPAKRGDGWSVVVEMGEWARLDMSFTDFLWSALSGELEIPIIEGDASFERVGGVQP